MQTHHSQKNPTGFFSKLVKATRQEFQTNPYVHFFCAENKQSLTQKVADAEKGHLGEIRIVVESKLPFAMVMKNYPTRQRAVDWFSQLRVWDTEHNSGILLYLLLSEKKIEIVADRGIAQRVAQSEWDAICKQLSAHLAAEHIIEGLHETLRRFQMLLENHYPLTVPESDITNPNELSDDIIFLA